MIRGRSLPLRARQELFMKTSSAGPEISYRTLFYILLAFLILSLIPLLVLGRYDVPSADDFSYGDLVYGALRENASFFRTLRAAVSVCRDMYYGWQGTFAAVFLMALQPSVFGEGLYALTPWLMLASLLAGVFCLCRSLFSRVFGLSRFFSGCVGALLCILSVQLIPCPVQSLYWYNGSVYYTFFYGLSLLAFALAVPTAQKGGWRIAPLCLLCAVLGGGNYVTALNASILFASLVLLLMLLRRPGWRYLLLPLALLLAAFALNAVAPGNAVRQSYLSVRPDAVWAIRHSFLEALRSLRRFFSLPLLGGMIALYVLFWNSVTASPFSFRLPGLVTVYSFCVYSALFTPTLYAQGKLGDGRMENIIFYFLLLILALNGFYWCGWLRRRGERQERAAQPLSAVLLCVAFGLGCCALYVSQGHGFTSLMALGNLRSGEAAAYHEAFEERLEVLHDEEQTTARLTPFPCTPYLLYFDDITDDPNDWRNLSVGAYYGKTTVILKN